MDKLVKSKGLAQTKRITCSKCQTKQAYIIMRERTWLTLLGLPLLPRATTYSYFCPACKNSHPLVKQQVRYMIKRAERYAEPPGQDPP